MLGMCVIIRRGRLVSVSYHTRSGSSQGTILCPLSFNFRINVLESVHRWYNDLKLLLWCRAKSRFTRIGSFGWGVNAMFQWSVDNKLLFNPVKYFLCTFSHARGPVQVQCVQSQLSASFL